VRVPIQVALKWAVVQAMCFSVVEDLEICLKKRWLVKGVC